MVVANVFQALQTFLLNKEALPDNLQKILDDQLLQKDQIITKLENERKKAEDKTYENEKEEKKSN